MMALMLGAAVAITTYRIFNNMNHRLEEESTKNLRGYLEVGRIVVDAGGVDLAILDIKLKKMSGIEVLAILKEDNPAMGAIMLTGYPTVETAREAISLGADEYCVKPIDRSELEEKVDKVLSARARR